MVRIAVVEKEKCNPGKCGQLCIRLCPINRTGKECILLDDYKKAKVVEELCTGCGICSNRCPFDSIHIINLPEELKQDPIHQYGENGFRLYSLPTPIFGKVVGIVGRNGIGKSTAIKILAGILKPNLGKIKVESGWNELVTFFKGTEAQIFFEKIRDGKIKVAYKPQAVDAIPKAHKGKVRDLLKKADEKNEMEKICEELQITPILDNEITQISGGELQRVAIAATVLKKANLYIFDEPTSYLDIKQRIRISRFIQQLANEETAIIVIEHDLIILDYMADLVHIMYGKEGCYGVVSQTKTVKAGINVYLSGYLKEENVRFRDQPIKFSGRPHDKTKEEEKLIEWNNIEKKFGKFHLKAKEGTIEKHKVIGVLGENGIGKTSFVKILAGVEKQDKGEINGAIRASYKPQYLDVTSDELVMSVFGENMQKYENMIMKPLNIQPLLLKKLSELSGGELQRVAIARALTQEADVFLLDEPSAYLDVEQRIIVSKILRDFMELKGKSALVVDHDLLFIDYLSQRLIVFEGESAIKGEVIGPYTVEDGMNRFLEDLNMTFRRDEESGRPRANKEESQMDQKQKREGKRYYS